MYAQRSTCLAKTSLPQKAYLIEQAGQWLRRASLCVHALFACSLLGLVVGCATPSSSDPSANKNLPQVSTPAQYKAAASHSQLSADAISPEWWRGFNDDYLNSLIQRSLAGNLDLAIAVARIEESGAAVKQVGASLLPTVSSNLNVTRQGNRNPFNNDLQTAEVYSADAQVGWEIDLWGKLRKGVKARRAAYRASEADWRATYLTTVAQVANTYFLIRQFDEQLMIQSSAIRAAEQILEIYQAQLREGIGSSTQVLRQEAELSSYRRTLLDLQRERTIAENALATLLGLPPSELNVPSSRLTDQIRTIPVPAGLPAQLLSRRPDIVAASLRVLEAHELVGQAQLARLPSISLTSNANASGNLASASLSNIVKTATFGLGPSINIPIFDAKIGARIQSQKARAKTQEQQYRKTVLLAFQEVENALVNLSSRRAQQLQIRDEVKHLRTAAKHVNAQLEVGIVSQLEVLESQRRLLSAQQALLRNQQRVLADTVTLYKAMGGGWDKATIAAAANTATGGR